MAKFPRFLTLPIAAALIVSACGGGGTPAPSTGGGASNPPASTAPTSGSSAATGSQAATGGSITVTSLWGGAEETAFQTVLADFKAKTGITANYVAQRTDYATVLRTAIAGGNPPDVAIMPGIGFLRSFAKDGSIKDFASLGIDVSALASNYAPGILEIGQVDGKQYGLMVKFNSKSTVFYRPDLFKTAGVTAEPKTWDEFKTVISTLKSKNIKPLGLGAKDSWTLTDWFESIYIRQAGPDAYTKLFSKDGDWTDPTVKTAMETMKQVLIEDNVVGGINGALGAAFTDGIGQVFKPAPDAAMYYEGGFVYGIATGDTNKDLKWGDTIGWFDFPGFGNPGGVTIGGDVIAALTAKPGVKEFLQYMTTVDAGTTWAKTGIIISPIKGVSADIYPNESAKKEAAQVANAAAVRFDGQDLLPAGGPDFGAMLQSVIKGDPIDGLVSTFNTAQQAAWAAE
ncbi:MAG TPA: extracellular solute-binding protein [Candidatus Limnocylindrales bacterium]|nr:extracellular solute-binding protein [Candidatus Limnocylindrales bacterium]